MKEIPLSKGYSALVDDEDYEIVSRYKWSYSSGYAARKIWIQGKSTSQLLHRFIMGTPQGFDTDHINHNTLDNRRCNLRVCSRAENTWNTNCPRSKRAAIKSAHRGVHWDKSRRKWKAEIAVRRKRISLGCFANEEDAATVHCEAVAKLHCGFAKAEAISKDTSLSAMLLSCTHPQCFASFESRRALKVHMTMVHGDSGEDKSGQMRRSRKARGWSQREVAGRLRISRSYYSQIEQGVMEPPPSIQAMIIALLGCA